MRAFRFPLCRPPLQPIRCRGEKRMKRSNFGRWFFQMTAMTLFGLVWLSVVGLPVSRVYAATGYRDSNQIPTWAQPAIVSLTQKHVLYGFPDGSFHPNDPVTYEQIIAGIYNIFGEQRRAQDVAAGMAPMNHVSPWAQGYVGMAIQDQMVAPPAPASPVPAPDDYRLPAPRYWAAASMAYALGYGIWDWDAATRIPFTDTGGLPVELRMMINTAVDRGIASGEGNMTFHPYDSITRAQFAVMLEHTRQIAATSKSVRTYFPAIPQPAPVTPVSMAFYARGQGEAADDINRTVALDLVQHARQITYLNMLYATDENGNLINLNDWGDALYQDTLNTAHQNGIQTLLCIGNDNFQAGSSRSGLAHQILSRPAAVQNLIRSVITKIQAEGDSGVNIDFEDMANGDRALFSQFVAAMSQAMKPYGWKTVVSVIPKTNDWTDALYYDYPALGSSADYIFLMTYDQSNPFGTSVPGPTYTANYLERVLKYSTTAIPPQKILLGVGNHNWVWNDPTRYELTHHQIDSMIAAGVAVPHWDSSQQSSYATYMTASGNTATVYYQNDVSYQGEYALIRKYQLGGIGFFPLGWEDDGFWNTLTSAFPDLR
jgi:spore germination protein